MDKEDECERTEGNERVTANNHKKKKRAGRTQTKDIAYAFQKEEWS